jgi:hypothetical protein
MLALLPGRLMIRLLQSPAYITALELSGEQQLQLNR